MVTKTVLNQDVADAAYAPASTARRVFNVAMAATNLPRIVFNGTPIFFNPVCQVGNGNATEGSGQGYPPLDKKNLRRLAVLLGKNGANPTSGDIVFTLRLAGVDSAVARTINFSAVPTNPQWFDITVGLPLAVANDTDLLSLRATNSMNDNPGVFGIVSEFGDA